MRKIFVIVSSFILSMFVTLFIGDIFSLYHFGSVPTITTIAYLISLFCIIVYIFLSVIYVINKKKNKEKIEWNTIVGLILFFVALMMILGFVVILDIDWLNHYLFSSPFYINIIVRSLEFLLPAIVLIIVGVFLLKKKK